MQSKSMTDWTAQIDSEQIFQLIDNLLPFEACLYHEVLPLAIKGSRLHLGMVDPEDAPALEYVRRILGYMRCSLLPEQIPADGHRSILTAYLNYMHTGKQKAIGGAPVNGGDISPPGNSSRNYPKQSALVVNSRGELVPSQAPPPQLEHLPLEAKKESSPVASSMPVLQVKASHLHSDVNVLATLPPNELLQELLARILVGGIGRLYFERQSEQGRILWSQDGVVQSVLEGLNISVFQAVMNELKRLVHLPLIPVDKPRQVEIERHYQDAELLLRLRVMPGPNGERATLQVLRGAALKFYKQQQIAELGRDALRLALQLQRKVDELRYRAEIANDLLPGHLEALPAINQLIGKVDEQLKALKALQGHEE